MANSSPEVGRPTRYLKALGAGLTGLITLFLVLLAAGSCRPPDQGDTDNFKNLYFFHAAKIRAAQSMSSPKTVIIGGSSGFFGVRSTVLAEVTGRPAVNCAVQAGLGLDYILHDAKRALRPGDTALLVLEYGEQYLTNGNRTGSQADFVLHHDPAYLLKLPPKQSLELMGLLSLPQWGHLMRRGFYVRPVEAAGYESAMNATGDILVNTRANVPKMRAALDAFSTPLNAAPGRVSPYAESQLAAFARWAKDHRVTVLATFPPFMAYPQYEGGDFVALTDDIRAIYGRLGIRIAGTAAGHLYPKSCFFDTWYHLHTDAAAEFSQKLGREMLFAEGAYEAPLSGGAEFSKPGYPRFLTAVSGLAKAGPTGRLTDGRIVRFRFDRDFFGSTAVRLRCRSTGGSPVQLKLRLGGESHSITIPAEGDYDGTTVFEDFGTASELVITRPASAAPVEFIQLAAGPSPDFHAIRSLEFHDKGWPVFVESITGFGDAEGWGRWSEGPVTTLTFETPTHGPVTVRTRLRAYGPNVGKSLRIRFGAEERSVLITSANSTDYEVKFDNAAGAARIEFLIPAPASPSDTDRASPDKRRLGIGLERLKITPALAKTPPPGFELSSATGLAPAEAWGSWSIADRVLLPLNAPIRERVTFRLRLRSFGPNAGKALKISLGSQTRTVRLIPGPASVYRITFDAAEPANRLELTIPAPTSPHDLDPTNTDSRRLGVGIESASVEFPHEES